MAGALNHMKLTILKRKIQAKRNAQAIREEEERQKNLPSYEPEETEPKMQRRRYSDKKLPGPPENKSAEPVDEPEEIWEPLADPLENVAFASPTALELARDQGLTSDDFDGLLPSGKTGFTTADVRLVLENLK
jgi:hypothetical protein